MHSLILANLTSYPKPILLFIQNLEKLGPIHFRYNPHCTSNPDFFEIVGKEWEEPITNSPIFVCEQNIKNTKVHLKGCVKNSNKNPTKDRKETVFALVESQMDMENKSVETLDLDHEV